MYSISEVATLAEVTSRALRHYEEKGLIEPSFRGNNGYRYYDEEMLLKIKEIKKLKEMHFSLEEIKSFLLLKEEGLSQVIKGRLQNKIDDLDGQISKLIESKQELSSQLLATQNFLEGKSLPNGQRRALMEAIKTEILESLKLKKEVSQRDLDYLRREEYLFDTPEKREFIEGIKSCLLFAQKEGIRLGPARGASPALLSLYALGWSDFDPCEYGLIPERFCASNFVLNIDVEFARGVEFIDYCRSVNSRLKVGKIEAFRLPILDIIDNVHQRLAEIPDYDRIPNDDPLVLDLFRKGDIEKIFSFDIPANTLLSKFYDDGYYKSGEATSMLSEYLKSQPVHDFRDLLNIEAIFRPDNLRKESFMREYIDRYPRVKALGSHRYDCLTSSLNESLKNNYGVIIYQEDIINIIYEYTSWDYERCNLFRRSLAARNTTEEEKREFKELAGEEVLALLKKEAPVAFCKAHSVGAWPKLIKRTAVLKSLHRDLYFDEIKKWESQNDYSWGDFGFIQGGVSLLQQ